jgi:peptide/nickel transport system permease protein
MSRRGQATRVAGYHAARVLQYLLRRLVSLVFVLVGMSVITFAISRFVPADPAAAAAGLSSGAGIEQIEQIRREMGLNDPLPVQYVRYMTGVLHGDLGRSILNRRPVMEDMQAFLPASLELALFSLLLYVPLGVLLGVFAARGAGGISDALTRLLAILGVSVPVFWSALLLQLEFYRNLRWFPSGGRLGIDFSPPPTVTNFYLIDSLLAGNGPLFLDALHHIALPAATLALANIALVTRMTRSSILEVLHADYIRTARAKGLGDWIVLRRHALRNAMVPVITVIGLQFAGLIAYVFLVEVVFSWPGIGTYAVRAIVGLDFEPIMGITLIFSAMYVLVNFLVDMSYVVLDPRIRY